MRNNLQPGPSRKILPGLLVLGYLSLIGLAIGLAASERVSGEGRLFPFWSYKLFFTAPREESYVELRVREWNGKVYDPPVGLQTLGAGALPFGRGNPRRTILRMYHFLTQEKDEKEFLEAAKTLEKRYLFRARSYRVELVRMPNEPIARFQGKTPEEAEVLYELRKFPGG